MCVTPVTGARSLFLGLFNGDIILNSYSCYHEVSRPQSRTSQEDCCPPPAEGQDLPDSLRRKSKALGTSSREGKEKALKRTDKEAVPAAAQSVTA